MHSTGDMSSAVRPVAPSSRFRANRLRDEQPSYTVLRALTQSLRVRNSRNLPPKLRHDRLRKGHAFKTFRSNPSRLHWFGHVASPTHQLSDCRFPGQATVVSSRLGVQNLRRPRSCRVAASRVYIHPIVLAATRSGCDSCGWIARNRPRLIAVPQTRTRTNPLMECIAGRSTSRPARRRRGVPIWPCATNVCIATDAATPVAARRSPSGPALGRPGGKARYQPFFERFDI